MKRGRAQGPQRFEVLVGAAVLANNLLRIAELLRTQSAKAPSGPVATNCAAAWTPANTRTTSSSSSSSNTSATNTPACPTPPSPFPKGPASKIYDLGQALGCGAHLRDLRRLSSAEFTLEQARTIPQLQELADAGRLEEALIPAARLLPDFPSVYVESLGAGQIRQGRNFPVSPFRVRQGTRYVKAVSSDGDLIAIGEAVLPNLYHPAVVL